MRFDLYFNYLFSFFLLFKCKWTLETIKNGDQCIIFCFTANKKTTLSFKNYDLMENIEKLIIIKYIVKYALTLKIKNLFIEKISIQVIYYLIDSTNKSWIKK